MAGAGIRRSLCGPLRTALPGWWHTRHLQPVELCAGRGHSGHTNTVFKFVARERMASDGGVLSYVVYFPAKLQAPLPEAQHVQG
jgi:hypothetical protein